HLCPTWCGHSKRVVRFGISRDYTFIGSDYRLSALPKLSELSDISGKYTNICSRGIDFCRSTKRTLQTVPHHSDGNSSSMSSNEQLPSMAVRRFSTLLEDEEERQLEAKVDKNLDRFHQSRWGIWMDFAETTTLHGPIHITATKGKLRIYYIIVVAMMAGMFFAHAGYLFKQYLSFPVLTEIKYGNIDFTYPDITMCPNAPFTDTEIAENAKLHAALNSTIKFWTEARRVNFGSPTAHAKRSFLSTFYRWSHEIGKKPYQHVLECQAMPVDVSLAKIAKQDRQNACNFGESSETAELSSDLCAVDSVEECQKNERFSRNSAIYRSAILTQPLFCRFPSCSIVPFQIKLKKEECMMNFIITEHPIYYRCFTLRVETKPPVPSGPTNGLRLILHRGQPGANPLLLVVEEEPVILQSVTTKEAFRAKDGFFITFHERGTFPNFPVQQTTYKVAENSSTAHKRFRPSNLGSSAFFIGHDRKKTNTHTNASAVACFRLSTLLLHATCKAIRLVATLDGRYGMRLLSNVFHLPNGLSLRFGEAVRVGLDQVHYKAVNITGRMCINGDFAPQIELFRLDKLSESNAKPIEITKSMAKFSYTRQACVAVLRQRLTYTKCKCFSESYAIPYSMRDVGEVWCHSLDTSTINIIRIGETLECAERIANMTDIQVSVRPLAKTTNVNFFTTNIALLFLVFFVIVNGLASCVSTDRNHKKVIIAINLIIITNNNSKQSNDFPNGYCAQHPTLSPYSNRMISIHSSLQTKLIQSLDPKILIPYFETIELHHSMQKKEIFIKQDGPRIDPKDLIFLDIHPVTEMVNQLIENPGYTATKFVSDLGGISGLYVGITVYTLAELVDLVTQFLGVYVPYVWSAAKLGMVRKKNLAARLKRRMTVRSIYGATSGADHVSANTTTTNNVNSQSCLEPSPIAVVQPQTAAPGQTRKYDIYRLMKGDRTEIGEEAGDQIAKWKNFPVYTIASSRVNRLTTNLDLECIHSEDLNRVLTTRNYQCALDVPDQIGQTPSQTMWTATCNKNGIDIDEQPYLAPRSTMHDGNHVNPILEGE
ncbi:sodium channel nonvoltage-gated 1 alpha, partial [Clonorchis sinensis]